MRYTLWAIGILSFAIFASGPISQGQTQAEMNEQAAKEARKADDALNKTYKELMALLDAEGKEKLKTSQRAWLKFRDAECEFEADEFRGGTIMPTIYSSCLRTLTEARTDQLKAHIKARKEP